jgi:hypothetical protein
VGVAIGTDEVLQHFEHSAESTKWPPERSPDAFENKKALPRRALESY